MTDGIRADLQVAAARAKDRKLPLLMDTAERHRLMDVLLRLNQLAMAAFDVLEANAISERDALTFLQIPDYCNAFIEGIERHARRLEQRA